MAMLVHLISCVFLLSLCTPPSFSDVVAAFSDDNCFDSFLDKKLPVIPGILHNGAIQNNNVYRAICQKYGNLYHFATLYDTSNKIPVFSALRYTGTEEFTRPNIKWRIEAQLEKNQQASNNDYLRQSNAGHKAANLPGASQHDVNKGHLIPSSYGKNLEAAKSTFVLTNAVPQRSTFNSYSWCTMEETVKKDMDNICKDKHGKIEAYVVTGAVPGRVKVNGVNIPELMWTAMCCKREGKWLSFAHLADNVHEKKDEKTISPITLVDLYAKLKDKYSVKDPSFQVFPPECSPESEANRQSSGAVSTDITRLDSIRKRLSDIWKGVKALCCCMVVDDDEPNN